MKKLANIGCYRQPIRLLVLSLFDTTSPVSQFPSRIEQLQDHGRNGDINESVLQYKQRWEPKLVMIG